MSIRKAAPDDMQQVYGLLCELENERLPFDMYKEIFEKNLKDPSIHYFVCENERNIIAFSSLHCQYLLHHCSRVAEIQELVVKNEYKENGIGKLLFIEMEKAARADLCCLMEVCCNRSRVRAHGFYEHCGMKKSHYKFTLALS